MEASPPKTPIHHVWIKRLFSYKSLSKLPFLSFNPSRPTVTSFYPAIPSLGVYTSSRRPETSNLPLLSHSTRANLNPQAINTLRCFLRGTSLPQHVRFVPETVESTEGYCRSRDGDYSECTTNFDSHIKTLLLCTCLHLAIGQSMYTSKKTHIARVARTDANRIDSKQHLAEVHGLELEGIAVQPPSGISVS